MTTLAGNRNAYTSIPAPDPLKTPTWNGTPPGSMAGMFAPSVNPTADIWGLLAGGGVGAPQMNPMPGPVQMPEVTYSPMPQASPTAVGYQRPLQAALQERRLAEEERRRQLTAVGGAWNPEQGYLHPVHRPGGATGITATPMTPMPLSPWAPGQPGYPSGGGYPAGGSSPYQRPGGQPLQAMAGAIANMQQPWSPIPRPSPPGPFPFSPGPFPFSPLGQYGTGGSAVFQQPGGLWGGQPRYTWGQ